MSDTLIEDFDDPTMARNAADVAKYVKKLRLWMGLNAHQESILTFTMDDAKVIPSRRRCRQEFATAAGKSLLAEADIKAEQMLKVHEHLAPRLLKLFYAEIQRKPGSLFSDLPLRLSETAFELNLLPECLGTPSTRVFRMLGEDNPNHFERVRSTVLDNVFHRMHMIMLEHDKNKTLQDWSAEYKGDRTALPFLDTLFSIVAHPYAMELQNALEFTGFDLEDTDIINHTINSHERFFRKEPVVS